MTTEIIVRHGKTDVDRLFGHAIFLLVNSAHIGKHYENETLHGTLRIFKHIHLKSGFVYYNVYYFRHSFLRRMMNYIKDFFK
jgi:hypothetical protein